MEIPYGEIIGWAGGSAAVISGVGAWIGQLYLANKTEKWRSSTETDLKIIDNKLSEKTSILSNLIDIHKSNLTFVYERRIEAIDKIWKFFVDFDASLPRSVQIYLNNIDSQYIGTIDDIKVAYPDTVNLKSDLSTNLDQEFYIKLDELFKNLSYEKPYIGAKITNKIELYCRFFKECLIFMAKGLDENKFNHWSQNKKVKLFLREFNIPDDLIAYLFSNNKETFDLARGIMIGNILDEIEIVLSGKSITDVSFERFQYLKIKLDQENKTAP